MLTALAREVASGLVRLAWLGACVASPGCEIVLHLDHVAGASAGDGGSGGGGGDAPIGTTGKRTVFVTSTSYVGDMGGANGLAGADGDCQQAANMHGLPGAYQAWLSTASMPAAGRIPHSGGPFVLVNGTTIAADWAALTTTSLLHPIDVTEAGATVSGSGCDVWTNTTQDGLAQSMQPTDDCYDWTTIDQGAVQTMGSVVDVDARWTVHYLCAMPCLNAARLYCIQN